MRPFVAVALVGALASATLENDIDYELLVLAKNKLKDEENRHSGANGLAVKGEFAPVNGYYHDKTKLQEHREVKKEGSYHSKEDEKESHHKNHKKHRSHSEDKHSKKDSKNGDDVDYDERQILAHHLDDHHRDNHEKGGSKHSEDDYDHDSHQDDEDSYDYYQVGHEESSDFNDKWDYDEISADDWYISDLSDSGK